mmetsp:Transcript_73193/g.114583  ORF Transcript_73193/g.114583 Transcript_73193/m.114583 type:complete len:119 (-) Transcript_73193:930-1286(-)
MATLVTSRAKSFSTGLAANVARRTAKVVHTATIAAKRRSLTKTYSNQATLPLPLAVPAIIPAMTSLLMMPSKQHVMQTLMHRLQVEARFNIGFVIDVARRTVPVDLNATIAVTLDALT